MKYLIPFILLLSAPLMGQSGNTYKEGTPYPLDGVYMEECMSHTNTLTMDPIFTRDGIMADVKWVFTMSYNSPLSGTCVEIDSSAASYYTFEIPSTSSLDKAFIETKVDAYKNGVYIGSGYFAPEVCNTLLARK